MFGAGPANTPTPSPSPNRSLETIAVGTRSGAPYRRAALPTPRLDFRQVGRWPEIVAARSGVGGPERLGSVYAPFPEATERMAHS